MLSDDKSSHIKENQTLIGVLDPYNNKCKLESLAKKTNLSLEPLHELLELNPWIYCRPKLIWLVIKR